MAEGEETQFFRLDDFEADGFPSKSQILDLAEQKKINFFIKCFNQRGVIFSIIDGKAIGHREATYSGHLKLTLEASSMLSQKGSHLVKVGTVVNANEVLLDETPLKQCPNYLFETWEPIYQLNEGTEYGFYLKVLLGDTLESALEISERVQMIMRGDYNNEESLNPFSEIRGALRDSNLIGEEYTISQVRIDGKLLNALKKMIKAECSPKKPLYRKTDFTKLLVRILTDNVHATANEIYQILENECDSEVKKYDIDCILIARTNEAIQWVTKTGKKTWVRFKTFDQNVSRIRGLEGLNKK